MDLGERIVHIGIKLIYSFEDFLTQPAERRERFIIATLVVITAIAYIWWWGSWWVK